MLDAVRAIAYTSIVQNSEEGSTSSRERDAFVLVLAVTRAR
jgi:hypothetical protein